MTRSGWTVIWKDVEPQVQRMLPVIRESVSPSLARMIPGANLHGTIDDPFRTR